MPRSPPNSSNKKNAWFHSDEAKTVVGNVLSWQTEIGSWPKNGDTATKAYVGDLAKLKGTFDNGATTSELRFLGRATALTKEPRYQAAFERGLDLILKSQYPTGGWPQLAPPGKGYTRHITFNDNTMVRILELLKEVAQDEQYHFVDEGRRRAAQKAFDAGIECIIKCQIQVAGKKTVWCAQHDEVDYSPRPARAFELVSLSGFESAGILRLLMRMEQPNEAVRMAIESGVAWFAASEIKGIRVEEIKGDTVVVKDPDAAMVWARFYEIETNRPIFCGRDAVKKYALAEIEAERRNGYGWYGDWGEEVLKEYKRWKEFVATK